MMKIAQKQFFLSNMDIFPTGDTNAPKAKQSKAKKNIKYIMLYRRRDDDWSIFIRVCVCCYVYCCYLCTDFTSFYVFIRTVYARHHSPFDNQKTHRTTQFSLLFWKRDAHAHIVYRLRFVFLESKLYCVWTMLLLFLFGYHCYRCYLFVCFFFIFDKIFSLSVAIIRATFH